MNKNLKYRLLLVAGVILACLYFSFPLNEKINLGLDLKGGMHLVIKVETEKVPDNQKDDVVARAMEILRNRIDALGVGETLIQRQGQDEIIVQLPGITDRDKALSVIGKVAQLEFRLVHPDPLQVKNAVAGNVPPGYILKYLKKEENEPILVEDKVALSGEMVKDARVDFATTGFGEPKISLSFSSTGARDFAELTQKHVGERLAIIVDDEVYSAPNIREAISSGTAEITGVFSVEEASVLALALRSGSLPAPMHVEEERTIGPLLGRDSIHAGINAILLGVAAVFLFMLIYYLLSGFIADIALSINLLMIVGIMGFLNTMLPASQATLTLPGIAGILLTLGMAVDANVLINERIREELTAGRPMSIAVNNGFSRAFSAIFDSNLTTLIAAFMLYQFGSGPIKGFAITLTIGIISTLFTGLTVSKTIFELILHYRKLKTLPMLQFFGNTKIDFISKRYFFYALSLGLIMASLVGIWTKKQDAYGIDFAGGQLQEYRFKQPIPAEDIRNQLKKEGLPEVIIQQFASTPENVIIRSSEDTFDKVMQIFKTKFPNNKFEVLRVEKVGPVVGQHLRQRALWAIILALGGILVYVGFRFKHFDFAAAGVIALLHDVFLGAGILVLLGRQIDLLVVTALLTIAGYSINDTIVIYDRVRENMLKTKKVNLKDIINLSVNQTLGRTILTSSVTLLTVIALYLFGGEVLNTFALCLLIGFISGVYSTVFIASPLVLAWHKK